MNPKVYQRLSSYYLFTSTDQKTQTLRRWTVYSKKSMAQDYFLSFYFISWAINKIGRQIRLKAIYSWMDAFEESKNYKSGIHPLAFKQWK